MVDDRFVTIRDLTLLQDQWSEASLDPAALARVRALLDRRAELTAEHRALTAEAKERTGFGSRLVDGQIDFATAVTELAARRAVDSQVGGFSIGQTLVRAIDRAVIAVATRHLRDHADGLHREHVAPAIEEVDRELAARRVALDGIDSADAALAAGPNAAKAWTTVAELEVRQRHLLRVRGFLVRYADLVIRDSEAAVV